jgi:hypothetical protein
MTGQVKQKLSKLDKLKIAFNLSSSRKHSHDQENARRRKQIAEGIIKVTAGGHS